MESEEQRTIHLGCIENRTVDEALGGTPAADESHIVLVDWGLEREVTGGRKRDFCRGQMAALMI
jgi:hypothetical protein